MEEEHGNTEGSAASTVLSRSMLSDKSEPGPDSEVLLVTLQRGRHRALTLRISPLI